MVDLVNERNALPLTEDDEKARKKAAKKFKKLQEALETRVLDPWERYRALRDLYEEHVDIVELLDRKTRFALIILGTVNALNLVVVVRPEFQSGLDQPWLGMYIGAYVVLSVYLFVKAIDALKPRFQSLVGRTGRLEAAEERPRLRFMTDIVAQTPEAYYETWQHAQVGQLNRELAIQTRELARVNLAKFAALNWLFKGLLMLLFLTAGLISVIAYRALMG